MKRTRLATRVGGFVVGLAAVALLPADASGYYHPRLGRFIQRDPSGYKDGMSPYEYVSSMPLDHADPAGLAKASQGGGQKGDQATCCCDLEPEMCYFEVELGIAAQGEKFPAYEGLYVGAETIDVAGTPMLRYRIELAATVTLKHKDPEKSVEDCYLKQTVTYMHSRRDSRYPFIGEKAGYVVDEAKDEVDYDRNTPQVVPDHRQIYWGWTLVDMAGYREKTFLGQIAAGYWQAHVYVDSAPSVETWYGFAYSVTLDSGQNSVPEWGLAAWADEDRRAFSPFLGARNLGGAKLQNTGTDTSMHQK